VLFPGALNITSGTLNQGSSTYGLKTGGDITIGANGIWKNIGSGYDSLGGNVINNGLIYMNGGGYVAGDADVALRSTGAGVNRTWSGAGKYFLTDVDVKNQLLSSGTVYMKSSAITGTCTGFDTTTHSISKLSIGTSSSAIVSAGTATVAALDSVVTFAGVALGVTVGEGDRIIFDVNGSSFGPETCYVKSRDNATQMTLQLVTPYAFTGEDYEIRRVFNTMQAWETAREDDLIAQKVLEKGICYDDGAFTAGVTISGSTCDASHYLWLTAAVGQRHNGMAYSNTGVRIDLVAPGHRL
jgi:hypothetical protein